MRTLRFLPLLLALSCGGDKNPPTHTSGTLVTSLRSGIGNLNPIVYTSAEDGSLITLLNFPTIESGFDCELTREPGLAETYEWSEDGKTLSMNLRKDITWADGKPVTAQDIAFAYELYGDPNVASARISSLDFLTEDGRPKIIDDYHIEWHFTKAYNRSTQLSHVSLGAVPKHIFETADRATLRGHERSLDPLPSGPFQIAIHEPNQRIVLEANPNFTGPEDWTPKLDRIVYRVIPEYSTALAELLSGGIDMLDGVSVEDADRIKQDWPDFRILRRGWRFNDYIAWNSKKPMFADKRVRQALTMAMDIEGMIGKLMTDSSGEAYATPMTGTITPALCDAYNADIKRLPFDPEASKALFAEAGWTDSDGDGWLDKDGETFEFTLSTNAGNARRASSSILIQAALKEVGVKVNLTRSEANVFFERLRNRDYDAALAGWSAALYVDPSSVWHSDTEEKTYQYNFTSYSNPYVDELLKQGNATPDPAEANAIWRELQQVIYDDQPYTFLWWRDELTAIHKRFDHVQADILSPYTKLREWDVPSDQVKYRY